MALFFSAFFQGFLCFYQTIYGCLSVSLTVLLANTYVLMYPIRNLVDFFDPEISDKENYPRWYVLLSL